MNNGNIKNSASVAFVIGALAGGVAALLLAPESGKDLRRRLRSGAGEIKDRAREKSGSVTGAVKSAITEAKHTYKDEIEKRRQPETEQLARRTGA
jgi:gas vesicle protein